MVERRVRVLFCFCCFVAVYSLYVVLVAVPAAVGDMQELLHEARRVSALEWKSFDLWAAAAEMGSEASGGLSRLVRKTGLLLRSVSAQLFRAVARGLSAPSLALQHARQFHAYSSVRHAKICLLVNEGENVQLEDSLLLKSLSKLPRDHVHVAVYLASRDKIDDSAVRRKLAATSIAMRVPIRRILCDGKGLSLTDCAAEQCLVDGFGYWIPASADWTLKGSQNWAADLVQAFKNKADLGAITLSMGGTKKAVAFARGHVQVFGPAVGAGAEWATEVYGNDFLLHFPESTLSIIDGRGGMMPIGRNVAQDASLWHEHLCRELKWGRYCTKEDVAFFSKLPHPHGDVSLTREEFEAMEAAAKAGHLADMGPILEAQRAAQEAGRARRALRLHKKAALIARERTLLGLYLGSEIGMSDVEVRWEVLAMLYDRFEPRPIWRELKHWSPEQIVERAEGVARNFSDLNRLRVALETLTNGLVVLPYRDVELLHEANWILRNVSGDKGGSIESPKELRMALEKAWPKMDQRSLCARISTASATPAENYAPKVDSDALPRKRPCVVDSVTVPEPWFAMYADDEMSNECFSSKQNAEKCCDYSSEGALCVAAFHGHEAKDMRRWIRDCRMPHWGVEAKIENHRCRWAGVMVPLPWHRKSGVSDASCVAPKVDGETCCEPSEDGKWCVVNFEGFSAQSVNDWINECRGKHWE